MPHDKIGNKIEEGDIVVIFAKVVRVDQGEKDCNAEFRFIGTEPYLPLVNCNSRLCIKAEDVDKKHIFIDLPIMDKDARLKQYVRIPTR